MAYTTFINYLGLVVRAFREQKYEFRQHQTIFRIFLIISFEKIYHLAHKLNCKKATKIPITLEGAIIFNRIKQYFSIGP